MKAIEAVDLFCGAGGLTKGLQLAGINVRAGIDWDISCKKTYEYNTGAKFNNKNIKIIPAKEILSYFSKSKSSYRMIAGCAPCQPFSNINTNKVDGDERISLLNDFTKIISETLPDFILMENVSNLTRKNKFFDKFIKFLYTHQYKFEIKILNANNFSVAQSRKRLFVIATKIQNIQLTFNKLINSPPVVLKDIIYDLEPITHTKGSIQDKLHRSRPLRDKTLQRIIATPKDGGLRSAWPDELKLDCHKNKNVFLDNYGRLSWHTQSSTITTKFNQYTCGRFGHPEQNRALSLREGALIQSFPPNYSFFGNDTEIARQIGNAVPVKLAQSVGSLFVKSIN